MTFRLWIWEKWLKQDDRIFYCWFNVTNKVCELVSKDITLDTTREITGIDLNRGHCNKFHFHVLSGKDQKRRDVVTGSAHTLIRAPRSAAHRADICCFPLRQWVLMLDHGYLCLITVKQLGGRMVDVFHSWFKETEKLAYCFWSKTCSLSIGETFTSSDNWG